MAVRLNRWGHSLGLRIPAFVAKACGLVVGDYVFIRINHETGEIIMVPTSAREVDPRYFSGPELGANEWTAPNAQDC